MTAFVLVPGPWTAGWVWREVAARLREAGAEAYPATLTGMGERSGPAGPGTDLETHIGDLLRLVDHAQAPDVVLVGHGMGIHPVLGAADRRPDRIARIVSIDAGPPQDGESVLDLVPDEGVRERLRAGADEGRRIPPPSLEDWPLWGTTDGITAQALARLASLAVPQPLGTVDQPLRLSGAAAGIPLTGILCRANGSSIAMVETVVAMGDPRFQSLTDPRARFFELATGHWPMLSAPDELAEVLLRAADGGGRRLSVRQGGNPAHRPFLLDVPERPRERTGRIDLYLPDAGQPRPAVVFVHGGPVPRDARPTPRDWPVFAGYGRYLAARGAVVATLDHGLHGLGDYPRAADDVAEAVERVRADPRVDGERVALWFFSSGGLLSADWLAAPPSWLRCVAASYPVLAPLPGWGIGDPRFRPAAAVNGAGSLPVVLTRVGREQPGIAATVEEFLAAAGNCGADVEVVDVAHGGHGFDTADPTDEARHAVEHAVRAVLGHLRG